MEFKNARVIAKANIYFDGKVTSRTIYTEDGVRKTLGIFLPGEYSFNTDAEELMEILGGKVDIRLAGQEDFTLYTEGTDFTVPANSSFDLKVYEVTDYCCTYK
ncbi:MAG: pyrimidine/purine nucleoside phosphorylase [Firmicutes bacterium]|jgi:uncharacterized protein YaiE (UPF0345 family)|nr:pyrimidine/purine nucleoside phosphorylase [Bacillota bacterium]